MEPEIHQEPEITSNCLELRASQHQSVIRSDSHVIMGITLNVPIHSFIHSCSNSLRKAKALTKPMILSVTDETGHGTLLDEHDVIQPCVLTARLLSPVQPSPVPICPHSLHPFCSQARFPCLSPHSLHPFSGQAHSAPACYFTLVSSAACLLS